MVLDDEIETRDLLRFVLSQCEGIVTSASQAQEAVALVRDGSFDMLIRDIGMPGMDGYSLIRAVRALPGKSSLLPAIALTAHARSEDRALALRSGFDMSLTKPIEERSLVLR